MENPPSQEIIDDDEELDTFLRNRKHQRLQAEQKQRLEAAKKKSGPKKERMNIL